MTIVELTKWLREFAASAQAPAGQPNTAGENLLEVAALMEAYIDFLSGEARKQQLVLGVTQHNAMLAQRCTERRADPLIPCGGSVGRRCADCPRTLALTAGNRTIPG